MDGPRVENLASRHGNPRPISQTTSAPRSSHPNQERNFRVVGPLLLSDRPPIRTTAFGKGLSSSYSFFFFVSVHSVLFRSVFESTSVSVVSKLAGLLARSLGGRVNENLNNVMFLERWDFNVRLSRLTISLFLRGEKRNRSKFLSSLKLPRYIMSIVTYDCLSIFLSLSAWNVIFFGAFRDWNLKKSRVKYLRKLKS